MKNNILSIIHRGEKNLQWRGDNVKITALHAWVRRNWVNPPKICQICDRNPALDLANKGIYSRDFKNWEWLCRRCHMEKDGRLDKFSKLNEPRRNGVCKRCKYCGKEFIARLAHVKRGNGNFCSHSCSSKRKGLRSWKLSDYQLKKRAEMNKKRKSQKNK